MNDLPQTLKEAYPDEKYRYFWALQYRLDKHNATVKDWIDELIKHNHIMPEIAHPRHSKKIDYHNCILFVSEFGWAKMVDWVIEVYQ